MRQGLERSTVVPRLLDALEGAADERGLSSTHVLFPDEADRSIVAARAGWSMRHDCQFHWRNRGYGCFEEFLAGFTAGKRKKAKRERRRVIEGGISFRAVHGDEATRTEVLTAWELHRTTFRQRGSEPYLSAETFVAIARSMGGSLLFQFAMQGGEIVAVAVCFIGGDTLYGRYWGAAGDFHSLHFEACYHQGIEHCIAHGLARFEPGTQGEHKVARGFEPTMTHSAHRIADPRFARAIADYLRAEGAAVDEYAAGIRAHVPYRADLET